MSVSGRAKAWKSGRIAASTGATSTGVALHAWSFFVIQRHRIPT
jgi:hypothetical protein